MSLIIILQFNTYSKVCIKFDIQKEKEFYYDDYYEKHHHIYRDTIFPCNINTLHIHNVIIPGSGYYWISNCIVDIAAHHIPSPTLQF